MGLMPFSSVTPRLPRVLGASLLLSLCLTFLTAHASFAQVTFEHPRVVMAAEHDGPNVIDTADLDENGWMDVLVGSRDDDNVAWYPNEGGVFGTQRLLSTSMYEPSGVQAADVDGDGDLDVLAAAKDGGVIGWFENRGSGQFSGLRTIDAQVPLIEAFEAGDVDGDGDVDVVIASNELRSILLYPNLGSGVFGTPITVLEGTSNLLSVALLDVEGDGDLDIASNESNRNVAVYLNDSSTGFTRVALGGGRDQLANIVSDDLNGDSLPDLVSVSRWDRMVATHLNNGDGTFALTALPRLPETPFSVHTGDADHDGLADILASTTDGLIWYRNLSGGQFAEPEQLLDEQPRHENAAAADLNGDGRTDLVLLLSAGVQPWFQDGDGTYTFGDTIDRTFRGPTFITEADIDGDGDQDYVVCLRIENSVVWLENVNGSIVPVKRVISTEEKGTRSVAVSDFDGDGDIDVVSAATEGGHVVWHENLGNGMFADRVVIETGLGSVKKVIAADLDRDGDDDLAFVAGQGQRIAWVENLGGAVFDDMHVLTTTAVFPNDVTAVDLNLDGWLDLVYVSREVKATLPFKVAWFENLAGSDFGDEQMLVNLRDEPRSVVAGDLDLDGDPDLVTGHWGHVNMHINPGDGTSWETTMITEPWTGIYEQVHVVDLDGDRDLDVVAANWNRNVTYSIENLRTSVQDTGENTGNAREARFAPKTPITSYGDIHEAALPTDIDDDGDPDILIAATGSDRLVLMVHPGFAQGVSVADLEVPTFEDAVFAYPNPSTGLLTIEGDCMPALPIEWSVHDIMGRHVLQGSTTCGVDGHFKKNVDVKGLATGSYIWSWSTGGALRSTRFIVLR